MKKRAFVCGLHIVGMLSLSSMVACQSQQEATEGPNAPTALDVTDDGDGADSHGVENLRADVQLGTKTTSVKQDDTDEFLTADVSFAATTGTNSITDYMLMNVCVDSADRVIPGNPLECAKSRDVKAREPLHYFHADYAPESSKNICSQQYGELRKYVFPSDIEASDETSHKYPLLIHWNNIAYKEYDKDCNTSASNADTQSFLSVFGNYARLVGTYDGKDWTVAFGDSYRKSTSKGISRFDNSNAAPMNFPKPGKFSFKVQGKRSHVIGSSAHDIRALPNHYDGSTVAPIMPTITFYKHLSYAFGAASDYQGGRKTRLPLDTILQFGFAKVNATKDGPGDTEGQLPGGDERIYSTRELGYATRWEDWHAIDLDANAVVNAATAYDRKNCAPPANTEGTYSAHFRMAAVVDKEISINHKNRHYYSQDLVTTKGGRDTVRTWVMVGCHDFTNTHNLNTPINLSNVVDPGLVNRDFLTLFGAQTKQ